MSKVAVITGASAGFGEAIAYELAKLGFNLCLGARRMDRLQKVATEIQKKHGVKVFFHELDVQNTQSVQKFAKAVQDEFSNVDYLINNAGLALELDTLIDSKEENWTTVWNTNVMGVVRMIKSIVPLMKPHAGCRVINLGSVAGFETYEGGGPYTSSKFGLRSVTLTLRYELLEKGIGVSSVDPGIAETEFSVVRFKGDKDKAKKVYAGLDPLVAQDIAEIVAFVVSRPTHVNLDQILVMPTAQASAKRFLRK